MEGEIRVSVRNLVEFSIHGEDISPASSKQDMAAGTKGHRARQGTLEDVFLKLTGRSLLE